ncbi:Tubulin beta-2 chain [Verticillium dahliae VDG2]|nr:Tubulin beta-2 chain [Verticillium dahliae VDG2]
MVLSVTNVYHVADMARAKLALEAAQPDPKLRLLVGHVKIFELLMLELHDIDLEEQMSFHHYARGAAEPERRMDSDFKSLLLQKKSRRQIASVSDPAVNQHFAVLVQFSDPEPQITDWDVYRTYHVPLFVLLRGTNIDDLKITHLHIL